MKTVQAMLSTGCAMLTMCALALQTPSQAQVLRSPDNTPLPLTLPEPVRSLDPGRASASIPADALTGLGRIRVVNPTLYFVRVFANHAYVGTIAPHSELLCRAVVGRYVMRAVAFPVHDAENRWEPYRLQVEAGEISTWNLMN